MTEAGKRLLDFLAAQRQTVPNLSWANGYGYAEQAIRDALPAVEAEAWNAAWAESSIGVEGEIAEARAAALAEVRERVTKVPPACHSHSGLNCEKDDYGWCYLIDRAAVLAIIEEVGRE